MARQRVYERNRNRPTPAKRGYDAYYLANRRELIDRARRNGDPCWKCGKPFGPDDKITADHVVPVRRGGTGELSNLAPACETCNYGYRRRRPQG